MRGLALALMLWPGCAQAQDDRSYLTAFLENSLSGAGRSVVVTGFVGALSSRATIQKLTIADDSGIWLTLQDVTLDWNRAALFRGQVSVNTLRAGSIELVRIPMAEDGLPRAESRSFILPELPVSVEIGALVAERISLGEAVLGGAVEAHLEADMSLVGGEGAANLLLQRTDSGPAGRLAFAARFANASRQLSIDLDAREDTGGIAASLLGLPGLPSAALTIKGQGPLDDFTAVVGLQTDGVPRLTGEVQLTGDATGAQKFRADLGGDLAPLFLPDYAAFFGPDVALRAEGQRFADGRMKLADLTVTAEALNLHGQMDLAADGFPERLAVTGNIGLPTGAVLLPLPGAVETRIRSADLAITYDARVNENWTLQGMVLGLDRRDFKAGRLTLSGSGRIARLETGKRFDMLLDVAAEGLAAADPALATALGSRVTGRATVEWAEGDGVVTLTGLSMRGTNYAAQATGTIAGLDAALALTGKLEAQLDDVARFGALAGRPLGGSATLVLSGSGSPLSGAFDLVGNAAGRDMRAGIAELDNLLRGQSTIDFSARRDTNGTELRQLDITAAGLAVQARGRIASTNSTLEAQVRFDDIGVLGIGYRGSLAGKASFAGVGTTGRLRLDASGEELGIGVAAVDGLLAGDSRVVLDLGLSGGAVHISKAEIANPRLQASVTGVWDADGSDLRGDVALSDLRGIGPGFRGALTGKAQFTGSPSEGRVVIEALGRGLGVGVAELDRVLAGDNQMRLNLTMRDDVVQVETAELRNPQLIASATGTLRGAVRNIAISARLANLGVVLPEFPGALVVNGQAVQDANGTMLDLKGNGPGRIEASVKGRVAPGYRSARLAIKGTAQAALANAFIKPRAISGNAGFDLLLDGPLRLGSLTGTVSLSDGRLADPARNFALQSIAARAALAGGRANVSASAGVTTGGQITVQGGVGLAAPYSADLAVDIRNVTLRDPDLYETNGNGALTVTGPLLGGALIAGRVELSETELRVPSSGFAGAGDLPGLRHRNEPAEVVRTRVRAGLVDEGRAAPALRVPYRLDITISAPRKVFVRGRGLDAELGGELQLRGSTARVVPGGSLSLIRGRLLILGERLNLSEAELRMEGELVPYLRVMATTESDGITASVVIDGPADAPVVTFESTPELPQEEVLAQLLFGKTLQNLSALQAIQLAGAVRTLAGQGGEGLVAKLRAGIGLDNLDVKTATDGTSSVTVGKYLTEEIYSEFTVDQDGQTQINLNLDLREHITLRGRADSDGSAGFGILLQKDY